MMGMCLDGSGPFSCEVRRESIRLHYENSDIESTEFLISELDDAIRALEEAKIYIEDHRKGEPK
jgi:hypothetical protein